VLAEDRNGQVRRSIAAIASRLDARLGEVTLDLRDMLASQIQELDGDARIVELLGASIESNVAAIVHMLAHDIPVQRLAPPAAAMEYARRLAQRGVSVNALVRAYRVGHDRLLSWAFDEIEAVAADREVSALATRRLVADTFAYVDRISEQVVAAYEQEQQRWLAQHSTERAARIRDLLDGAGPGSGADLDAAEAVLGYPLRGRHLGLVVWAADAEPTTFERFVLAAAERPGFRARPLVSSLDRSTAWAWLPVRAQTDPAAAVRVVRDVLASGAHPVRVACGEVCGGLDGFRATHRQAVAAQSVALVAGPDAAALTEHAEAGAVALLCADLDATRVWVGGVLGPLATGDAQHARLRETLLAFLTLGSSYTAAAEQLLLHRNSVRYRVVRAEQVRGRPIRDDRFDVELALRACRWLGRAVLTGRSADAGVDDPLR
jgi:DNA-binding PucR family transcriptional regulator